MSSADPNSPNNATRPLLANQGVAAPPFRPPGPGAFMPPHRPPWGPPLHPGAAHPFITNARPPPGYFPPRPPVMPPPQQPRPVSSKPITGTDWLEVTNDNGTKFWHNTKTNQGVWQMPTEVKAAARAPPPLDAAKLKMLERARASGAVVAPQYKAAGKGDKGLLLLEGRGGAKGPKAKQSGNASTAVVVHEPGGEHVDIEEDEEEEFDVTFTEEDVIGDQIGEAKGRSENEKGEKRSAAPLPPPAGPPPPPSLETAKNNKEKDAAVQTAFRDLLKENSIHAFSRYEKELPKLQSDPRFGALLPPERRRAVFEDYCSKVGMDTHNSAKETKQEKKKQTGGRSGSGYKVATGTASDSGIKSSGGGVSKKVAEDAFKALLQERVVHPDIRWYRVKEYLKKDSRFDSNILTEERKEELFRFHIHSLEKLEEARERAARHTHYAKYAGEERQRYAQAAVAEQNFKVLLGEAVRDERADWESTWERLQRDPQGRATDPMLDIYLAERMFRDHVAKLKAAGGDGLEEEEGAKEAGEAGAGGGETRGLDPAYARAYLEGRDAKRPKRDT